MKNGNNNVIFNLSYSIIVFAIFLFIAGYLFNSSGIPGYNLNFLIVYGIGTGICIIGSLVLILTQFGNLLKSRLDGLESPIRIGQIADSSSYIPLSQNNYLRFGLHLLWLIIIIVVAQVGFTIWDQPTPYLSSDGFTVEKSGLARSLFDMAVIPGMVEDFVEMIFAVAIMMPLVLGLWLIKRKTKNNFFKFNKLWYTGFVIIATLIASVGFWFIPGFAQAHTIVGGRDVVYLASAFLFQWINLIFIFITGIYVPLAHILHNSIYVIGLSIAYSAFLLFGLIKNKRSIKNEKRIKK